MQQESRDWELWLVPGLGSRLDTRISQEDGERHWEVNTSRIAYLTNEFDHAVYDIMRAPTASQCRRDPLARAESEYNRQVSGNSTEVETLSNSNSHSEIIREMVLLPGFGFSTHTTEYSSDKATKWLSFTYGFLQGAFANLVFEGSGSDCSVDRGDASALYYLQANWLYGERSGAVWNRTTETSPSGISIDVWSLETAHPRSDELISAKLYYSGNELLHGQVVTMWSTVDIAVLEWRTSVSESDLALEPSCLPSGG
eukprot:m51a1_g1348 hypothetical protein (256) ;mRNA; f:347188-348927